MAEEDTAPPASQEPKLALLLGSWGHLLLAGAPEEQLLPLLASQSGEGQYGLLIRAAAVGRLQEGLEAHGEAVPFWLHALLSATPRDGACLVEASELLRAEGEGSWHRGLLWAKLRLLNRAKSPPGEALGALAREARDHGESGLAEAFNSAARKARSGSDLGEALLSAGGYTELERLALGGIATGRLEAVLRALEKVAELEDGLEREGTTPTLSRLADAASAGIERMLTGIEGVFGKRGSSGTGERSDLVRDAIRVRSERKHGPAPAPAPAPSSTQPPPPDVLSEPAVPQPLPGRKTIGADSGPVQINELHSGSSSRHQGSSPRERWLLALEEAKAKLTLIEVQPAETGLAQELKAELQALRSEVRELKFKPAQEVPLDDLELRYSAWKKKYG